MRSLSPFLLQVSQSESAAAFGWAPPIGSGERRTKAVSVVVEASVGFILLLLHRVDEFDADVIHRGISPDTARKR